MQLPREAEPPPCGLVPSCAWAHDGEFASAAVAGALGPRHDRNPRSSRRGSPRPQSLCGIRRTRCSRQRSRSSHRIGLRPRRDASCPDPPQPAATGQPCAGVRVPDEASAAPRCGHEPPRSEHGSDGGQPRGQWLDGSAIARTRYDHRPSVERSLTPDLILPSSRFDSSVAVRGVRAARACHVRAV
jgi:hypothetical protein